MIVRLAILLLLLATSPSLAEDSSPSPLEQRGRAWERMCSQCHAIGRVVRVRTLVPLPFARSMAAWILILSWSGCAKG
jgi:hypothetical protein